MTKHITSTGSAPRTRKALAVTAMSFLAVSAAFAATAGAAGADENRAEAPESTDGISPLPPGCKIDSRGVMVCEPVKAPPPTTSPRDTEVPANDDRATAPESTERKTVTAMDVIVTATGESSSTTPATDELATAPESTERKTVTAMDVIVTATGEPSSTTPATDERAASPDPDAVCPTCTIKQQGGI